MINSKAVNYVSSNHLPRSQGQLRGGYFRSCRSAIGLSSVNWRQFFNINGWNRATLEVLLCDHILVPIMSWLRLPWIFLFNGIWGIKNGFTNHFLIWWSKQGMKNTTLSSSSARKVVNKENKLVAGSHLISYLTTCYQLITHLKNACTREIIQKSTSLKGRMADKYHIRRGYI